VKVFLILGVILIGIIIFYVQMVGKSGSIENDINFLMEETDTIKSDVVEIEKNSIKVFDHKENILRTMPLEEYLVGVLAAEMPGFFQVESLKAQAIAARTYAFGRMMNMYGKGHPDLLADVCTDPKHCQAWVEKNDYMSNKEVEQGEIYWKKYLDAVYQTRGLIITYEDIVINPLFHSNSSGYTEDAQNLWSRTNVPYLQSVASIGDDLGYHYEGVTEVSVKEFFEKLKINFKKFDRNGFLGLISYERSESGRVDKIQLYGRTYTGAEIREIFGLRSTNFEIQQVGEQLRILTKGYGHGVGMSQWGANYMAINGSGFKEILKHYYTGVELKVAY
jgi:stage II sporulation protein D